LSNNKVLAIDVSLAGCAGDMLFAGLLGQFESRSEILSLLSKTYSESLDTSIEIKVNQQNYGDINGFSLEISSEKQLDYQKILDLIPLCCDKLNIDEKFKKISLKIFNKLLDSERMVHGIEEVHLHELGTSDTLIDIISVMYLLHLLNPISIYISPVATGSGTINTSHGVLTVPPPVTQKLIETSKIQTCVGPAEGEATTPTGAAILISLVENFQMPSNVTWDKSSYGFGLKIWKDRGNYLRIRSGNVISEHSTVSVLESNIDDVSSEVLGHTMDQLLEEGALDVTYNPIMMKKNRPAYAITVICQTSDEQRIADLIMKLTGTLGVRINTIDRHVGSRKTITNNIEIQGQTFQFRLKVGKYRTKIEFDDIVHIASKLNLTPLEVQKLIEGKING
jgi:uncharacterized protein (TIGR00299 family) protein